MDISFLTASLVYYFVFTDELPEKATTTTSTLSTPVPKFVFSNMETYIVTNGRVSHIELDIINSDALLFSESYSLKTTDGATVSLLIGSTNQSGYIEGFGHTVRFNSITDFTQINMSHIVVVDFGNNCLRWVLRKLHFTARLAGRCGVENGTADTQVWSPYSVVKDPASRSHILISDPSSRKVKRLNLSTGTIAMFVSEDLFYPLKIAVDPTEEFFFVTDLNHIIKYNLQLQRSTIFIQLKELGYADGPLEQARFTLPADLGFLDTDVMVLADRDNHRLRIVDTAESFVFSICVGKSTTRDGPMQTCGIDSPNSLLVNNSVVYVGQKGAIRILTCKWKNYTR